MENQNQINPNPNNMNNTNTEQPKTNKNAIYAITFSCVSIVIFWWLSYAGIGSGILALKEIKKNNEKGKVLAIAGIVIGVISNILYFYFMFTKK